ncbi:uncharacterized protein [Rutidosis leptorrhynchoides]|uniref:uncharacterized protein n=1 Tax=Rutidosis leptorrhynchoides TaxID=125765 RepID=UPI003A99EBDE
MAPERSEWLRLDVDKLVHANILREVRYHTWVANPILVKKEMARGAYASILRISIRRALRTIILCPRLTGKLNLFPVLGSNAFWMRIKGITRFRWQWGMKTKPHFHTEHVQFWGGRGQVLGHIVTSIGIKANPKKIEVVERMSSPKSRKEVQSLTDFGWTEEAEKAFVEMKSLLRELPTLTAPIAGETLMLYLVTSKEAISSVLIVQMHVYFVSKALSGSEVNYPPIEKLVYALLHTALRHRRYFQAHLIVVLTNQPIRQILVDYLAETTGEAEALAERTTIGCDENQVWELHRDGACGPEGAGARLVLTSPGGEEHTYALCFMFAATNNESEYEALLSGMRIAQQLRIMHLDAYIDSQLVANQVNGSFGVHEASMKQYMELVHELANEFYVFRLMQEKSIDEKSTVAPIEEESPNWMTPLVKFLTEGELPADEKEARKVRMKAPMYALIEGVLYRKFYLGPSLLCIGPNQAKAVLREVHEGSCALHSGYRTIAAKVMRIGY